MPESIEYTLGTDYGSYLDPYQRVMFAWKLMQEKLNMRFAVWKSNQEQISDYGNYSTKKNILVARQEGIRINGTYSWHFPDGSPSYYRILYRRAVEAEDPDFISVDAEQRICYRADGTTYKPSQAQVGETLQALCEGMMEDFPEKRFLLYSSAGYIAEFCPQIIPFLASLNQFSAGWPDWGLNTYRQTWEEIASGAVRQVTNYNVPAPLPYRMANIKDLGCRLTAQSKEEILWQYSSRILLPDDILIPVEARHQMDWIVYKGSEQKLYNWVHFIDDPIVVPPPEVITLTTIPINTVKHIDRATILTMPTDAKLAKGVTIPDLKVDAVILRMGGMDRELDGHWRPWSEETFPGRSKMWAAYMPVIGSFKVDAGALLKEQATANSIDGIDQIRNNWILEKLVWAWHDGPCTWDTILAKKSKWNPVSAIELEQASFDGFKGAIVDGDWQARAFRAVINQLKILMDNGQVPTVPIIEYTGPWWIHMYEKTQMYLELLNRKTWLYFRYGDWTQLSTRTFLTLSEILAFRPPEDFHWYEIYDHIDTKTGKMIHWAPPEGTENNILMHEYSGEAQKSVQIVDANDVPVALNFSLWQNTKAEMYKTLKWTAPGTPPPVDPTDPTVIELLAKIETMKAEYQDALSKIGSLMKDVRDRDGIIAEREAKILSFKSWLDQAPTA